MTTQGHVDGFSIDQFKGRIAGQFDLEDLDALNMGLDVEVMLVVTAKLKGAAITETPAGDVRRLNTLTVREVAVVRKATDRVQLAENFNLELPFVLSLQPAEAPKAVEAPAPTPEPEKERGTFAARAAEMKAAIASAEQFDEDEVDEMDRVPVATTSDPELRAFLESA